MLLVDSHTLGFRPQYTYVTVEGGKVERVTIFASESLQGFFLFLFILHDLPCLE